MKILMTNDGLAAEMMKRRLGRICPGIEVELVDILKLEEAVRNLQPGDVLVGDMYTMKPGGILDGEAGVAFIETLEDELLPKGCYAILIDLALFATCRNVMAAIRRCRGRIVLVDCRFTAEDVPALLDRWKSESATSPRAG